MIGSVKLLQQKGLFKQAVKYLAKAFDIATKHEKMTRIFGDFRDRKRNDCGHANGRHQTWP